MPFVNRSVLAGLATLGVITLIARGAAAQAPDVRVVGRIQTQYRFAAGDSTGNFNPNAPSSGFEIRRLRIQTDVRVGDNISLVIMPSFEMGSLRMLDAFVRVGLNPQFGLSLGHEKSPFQRYELISSNNLLSIERGVRILGLSRREGMNDLLLNNGYVQRDLGAFVDYAASDNRLTVKVGVQNGSRESTTDVNNRKSFYGRGTYVVLANQHRQPRLQIGASFAARDRAVCSTCTGAVTFYADSAKTTTAFGLDAEWGGFRPGWHVIADFATGDNVPTALRVNVGRNTANLRNTADSNVTTFRSVHLVGAYRIVTAGSDTRLVKMVEPALRIDYADPNTNARNDEGFLITPVLNIYFASTVLLRAGFDFYRYKDTTGTSRSARELKLSWQANF